MNYVEVHDLYNDFSVVLLSLKWQEHVDEWEISVSRKSKIVIKGFIN